MILLRYVDDTVAASSTSRTPVGFLDVCACSWRSLRCRSIRIRLGLIDRAATRHRTCSRRAGQAGDLQLPGFITFICSEARKGLVLIIRRHGETYDGEAPVIGRRQMHDACTGQSPEQEMA